MIEIEKFPKQMASHEECQSKCYDININIICKSINIQENPDENGDMLGNFVSGN